MAKTFAAAVKTFTNAPSKEVMDFVKACTPEERTQFCAELTDLLGETVTTAQK